jgi:hypothetical protein
MDNDNVQPAEDSITIDYKVRWRDYRESNRVLSSPKWPTPRKMRGSSLFGWALFFSLVAMLIYLLGGIYVFINAMLSHQILTTVILTLTAAALTLWIVAFIFIRRGLAKSDSNITFNVSGIDRTFEGAATHNDWSMYIAWTESDTIFVVILRGNGRRSKGIYVPKRLFSSPAELDRFRQLLTARIGIATVRNSRGKVVNASN